MMKIHQACDFVWEYYGRSVHAVLEYDIWCGDNTVWNLMPRLHSIPHIATAYKETLNPNSNYIILARKYR